MPLCVYDKLTPQDKLFGNCGLGILRPSKMTTYEELNGEYSISIEYPITKDDTMWMYLTPYNIVKNSEGQLFFIISCTSSMSNGKAVMQAKGWHISYYLADKNLAYTDYRDATGQIALNEIKKYTEYNWDYNGDGSHDSRLVDYDFNFSSDIEDIHHVEYEKMSPLYAILGAPNSVVNLFGGEIHRDNFHISVNKRKEGSRDNAFSIVHGFNMLEIQERVSVEDMITGVWGSDNYSNGFGESISNLKIAPHQVLKHVKFSYDGESNLAQDTGDYFNSHTDPTVSYQVRFKDLRHIPKYKEWAALQSYNIADSGQIKSALIGVDVQQKIISRTLNDITKESESITLGNFMPNLYRTGRYSSSIASHDASSRRLDALEKLRLHTMFTYDESGDS